MNRRSGSPFAAGRRVVRRGRSVAGATLLLAGLLLCASCTMIPEYVRPEPPVPPSWPEGEASAADGPPAGLPTPAVAAIRWQDFFAEPRLRAVIELTLAGNRDLRIASLQVERMSALYRIQRAELSPGVGLLASGEVVRLPSC